MTRATLPMRASLGTVPEPPLPDQVKMRRFEPADTAALGALMAVAYAGTVDDGGETAGDHLREAERTVAGDYGKVDWAASLLAEGSDAHVVGAAIVTHDRGRLLLAFALVHPDWRSQGLGTALIVRSANYLASTGATDWTLAVTVGNPAQRLYERLGFRVDHALRRSR